VVVVTVRFDQRDQEEERSCGSHRGKCLATKFKLNVSCISRDMCGMEQESQSNRFGMRVT
jgi:hypothetical protein